MHPAVQGALKSKTMWFAMALTILSNVQQLMPALTAAVHMDPNTVQTMGTILGACIACLRAVTTQSLTDKAAPSTPVSP